MGKDIKPQGANLLVNSAHALRTEDLYIRDPLYDRALIADVEGGQIVLLTWKVKNFKKQGDSVGFVINIGLNIIMELDRFFKQAFLVNACFCVINNILLGDVFHAAQPPRKNFHPPHKRIFFYMRPGVESPFLPFDAIPVFVRWKTDGSVPRNDNHMLKRILDHFCNKQIIFGSKIRLQLRDTLVPISLNMMEFVRDTFWSGRFPRNIDCRGTILNPRSVTGTTPARLLYSTSKQNINGRKSLDFIQQITGRLGENGQYLVSHIANNCTRRLHIVESI